MEIKIEGQCEQCREYCDNLELILIEYHIEAKYFCSLVCLIGYLHNKR